ncbi:MAG: PDZ domain-containing protein [Planctomycetota bacterium]
MIRAWRAVVMAVLVAVPGVLSVARSEEAAAAAPSAGEIAGWIEQLGAPQFARREAASKQLLAAGRPAIEPLAVAIRGGDLEVASRGVEILREMLAVEPLAEEAEAALEACADVSPAAARLAAAALEFHQVGQAEAARERLESLGAEFRERPMVELAGEEIEFGRAWKGSAADLRELTRLPRLRAVAFHGVRLDERGVAVLGRLRRVERIELFGTGLGDPAIAALGATLPDTEIDVRRGGKLGVGALAFGGPCEIQSVEPGSAADQAGVRPGDVVVAIDGAAVADFEGLTTRVSGRIPGDTIRLTVARRGGDPGGDADRMELEIRLDAW